MLTLPTDRPSRIFLATGALYLVVVLLVVVFGALQFSRLYTDIPPRPGMGLDEDSLIQTFERQYQAQYDDYRQFLHPSFGVLALYLGIWTAALGVWKRKYWLGLAALVAGDVITVFGLTLLPWMYFPLDQYAIAALWIMGGTIPLAICWLLATLAARAMLRRGVTSTTRG